MTPLNYVTFRYRCPKTGCYTWIAWAFYQDLAGRDATKRGAVEALARAARFKRDNPDEVNPYGSLLPADVRGSIVIP